MSYDERDAWLDEKARGGWPFERWSVGALPISEGYSYFHHPHGVSGIGSLYHRLGNCFGHRNNNIQEFRMALDFAIGIIDTAIDNADADAFSSWINQEIWLSILDDSIIGYESPADMLAQSIEYVGVPDGTNACEVSSALGLWLIGELHALPAQEDWRHACLLVQIGVSAAEAEYYRGLNEGRCTEQRELSKRAKKANSVRHAANRERVKQAEKWWQDFARSTLSQAEAARQISAKFHVVEDVAKRWIRQFKNNMAR